MWVESVIRMTDLPPAAVPRLNLTAKALDHLSAALQVTQPSHSRDTAAA